MTQSNLQRAIELWNNQGTYQLIKSVTLHVSPNPLEDSIYPYLLRQRHGSAEMLKIGFPKSGNTWAHFLMANVVVGATGRDEDVHFKNLKRWVTGSEAPPTQPPGEGFPRIRGGHYMKDEATYLSSDTDVVYIIRHPADVMESYYDWRNNWLKDSYGTVGTFSEFIRSEEHGIPAWVRNVESWENRWDVLVRFKDLKQSPATQLRKICNLFDREISESTIEFAVEKSSFENMARMEEKYGKKNKPHSNSDYTFMRSGESGTGIEYFDELDREYLNHTAGEVISRLDL